MAQLVVQGGIGDFAENACLAPLGCLSYRSAMDQAILEREALKLPAHERALLADSLLGSLDDEAVRQAESACAREADVRYQAYLRGELK